MPNVCDLFEPIAAGSWPDWVAAIGTSAAFLVAARSYGRSVADTRTAQAKLVYSVHLLDRIDAGELVNDDDIVVSSGVWDEADDTTVYPVDVVRVVVSVHNHSNQVISNVNVQLLLDYVDLPKGDSSEWETTPEATEVLPHGLDSTVAAIAPGETVRACFYLRDVWRGGYRWFLAMGFSTRLIFTDSAGHNWARTGTMPIETQKRNLHRPAYTATALG